ncbi:MULTISPECIES: polyprenyl diphosphate synthase [Idiomarina]|jgi:undecaprenyl diphosphate synthase|uniref:Ditrans,polycis-undecaprenyl-diphosphate synthase ((2E,6E)-farnesyl-diphosphate specific) n=2 Tax=Idiomarina baltica TaxID=190892 RepID=A0A348WN73_9GAMM|nr:MULTISPECIES: polyprenyl diphosphate synthase [Idiomarina]MAF74545.1 di-trans,poly-cis-decaprenylcistransferase [Idiomarinaceae bacterium]MEC8925303.1 polyprenyl diphosphate synthase [Pseudomonadota bacterium]EAQ32172.1 Undecaprenyl pyrophosphate synthase [Idiomarina baltica OS145]KXS35675.1 MAG: undecaprenyl diphosphate synthase [Idiomarina sp. T82-3]MBL73597.1 di-trans,poly-cis-decaprenylcistransferase [Idiomarinaceae bacterium]|tara:strand:+ start:1456 stop:2229 length:774 start_codon:yes stop_codon:yes gene_type:complete
MKQSPTIQQVMPKHVAIIMDGNGRWAKQQGKRRTFGHKKGAEAVRRAVSFARRNGIQSLTLFAFSSENWNRPAAEVSLLMELFINVLKKEADKLKQNDIKLQVIGDKTQFSSRLRKHIEQTEEMTAECRGMTLNIAANYGGQWDITQATRKVATAVANNELAASDITERTFERYLCLADQAKPDLLIRTGGEQRVSNFLLWQIAYAEFYFSPILWPDFDDQAFASAVAEFAQRERRYGLTSEQITELFETMNARVED